LSDHETALLVQPGNVAELTAALVRVTEAPELRARLGANARDAAVKNHTWGRNARTVLEAYDQWVFN
jgi:glycosyltransferase involved in cell wall biosynthesis